MWHRIELDDYVPVSPPPQEHHQNHGPICCTSEHFPNVLWPSLIEKAYAKLYTKRELVLGSHDYDCGGWEAIGAGGRVEDALVLLTGGVAGRFRTREVSADRLFIYLFERQTDTLFVCRVNQPACTLYGVKLNPYYSYSVNRAVPWEGRLYVQLFCGAPTCYDGGLQDISVPYSLSRNPDFPETEGEGFFWCDVNDFHLYFDTIFECHLVNTPPSAIPGMPPSRIPPPMSAVPGSMQMVAQGGYADQRSMQGAFPPTAGSPPGSPRGYPKGFGKGMEKGFGKGKGGWDFGQTSGMRPEWQPTQRQSTYVEGERLPYFQSVHANPGDITKHNAPEMTIDLPHSECEVIVSFDQYDERIKMESPACKRPAEILLKAYVKVNDTIIKGTEEDLWQMVCKSNWLPVNHSMLAFSCRHGCKVKVIAEFADGGATSGASQHCEKAIFRCYCTVPDFICTVGVATKRHCLGACPPGETPGAVKWSLVGSVDDALMENPDQPMEFDPETDCLRKPDQDVNNSWNDLKKERLA
jgi:hypothetical protein